MTTPTARALVLSFVLAAGIVQQRDDVAEIAGLDHDVAVVDNQHRVPGLARQV